MQSVVLQVEPRDAERQAVEAELAGSLRVLSARTATEALSLAAASTPDLVIFGPDLPDMTPLEACWQLRGSGRRSPVVLVLGHVLDAEWQLSALDAGVTAFLHADAPPRLVARQVQSLLAVGQDRRAILDAFSEGYYALDGEWRFIEFNAAAEEHFGRQARDLTGKDFWIETGIRRDSVIGGNFRAAASSATTIRFETESRLRPGHWYETHLHPRAGGGLNVYYRNITARKLAERALKLSEEKFAKAFHGSTAAMTITCVEDGRYLEVNRRWLETTGYRSEEVIGRTVSDIGIWKRPEDREAFVRELGHRGFLMNWECDFRRASGEEWVGLVSAQLTEIGNDPVIISSLLDITERRRAETALRESEARLRPLYDSGMIGVLYFNVDGGVTDANEKFLSTVGYTREDLDAGLIRWEQMTPPEYRPLDDHALAELRMTGVDTPYEKEFIRKDGTRVPVFVGAAVFDDARHHGIAFVLDITDRKRAEQALRRVNVQLAEADRRKDEFIAILSHELRNPLAPIRYALPLLQAQKIDEAGMRALSVVHRQVDHLTRLVDDLLDISRISRGKIELRRGDVTLDSVVAAAYEAASPAIAAARHTLTLDVPEEPIWLHADAARMAQVVTNLLNNSAKYTPRGGKILLQARRHHDRAVIRVRDNGIGIPGEALPSIFDMFKQVNRPDHAEGGLGIGLALARLLVEMHGGTIEAHSEGVGRGAEFVVMLPAARNGRSASAARPQVPLASHRRLRVLVVDDNADLVEMLALTVTASGHEVRTALDGRTAVSAAISFRPDVVLLDIGLPVMTGLDVARELRRRPDMAGIRLVALTGWGQAEDRRRTREAGFDRHLTKPTEPLAVTRLLEEFASEA